MYRQGANGKSKQQLARFLLTRGAWLIALELTVISFGFNFALPFQFLQIIWAIGVSMILLAGVIWLPRPAAAVIGVLIVAGHQLLAPVTPADLGALAPLWMLAFKVGPSPFGLDFVPYPVIPWFGVMCLGYAIGPVFVQEPARRNRPAFFVVCADSRSASHCCACLRSNGCADCSHACCSRTAERRSSLTSYIYMWCTDRLCWSRCSPVIRPRTRRTSSRILSGSTRPAGASTWRSSAWRGSRY